MKIRIALCALVLAGCNAEPDAPGQDEPKGRAETQSIRNTDAVGYSGGAIADQVDATLDANDQRNRRLEEADAEAE